MFGRRSAYIRRFSALGSSVHSGRFGTRFFNNLVNPVVNGASRVDCNVAINMNNVLVYLNGLAPNTLAMFTNFSERFSRPVGGVSRRASAVFTTLTNTRHMFRIVSSGPRTPSIRGTYRGRVRNRIILGSMAFNCIPRGAILGGVDLCTGPNRGVTFINSANTNGAAVAGLVGHFCSISRNRVLVSNIGVGGCSESCLERRVTIILRSARLFANAIVRGVHCNELSTASRRMVTTTGATSTRSFVVQLTSNCSAILRLSNTGLSRNRERLLGVTETTVSGTPVLVLSRTASDISAHARQRVRRNVSELVGGHAAFIVTRQLSAMEGTGTVVILRRNRVVRHNSRSSLLTVGNECCRLCANLARLTWGGGAPSQISFLVGD